MMAKQVYGAVFALAIVGLVAVPVKAAWADGPDILVVGTGNLSCASWLSSHLIRGTDWIGGYWTARNRDNAATHQVGITTDPEGIIGEVKKLCQDQPSLSLFQAVGLVYSDMSDRSR
jgi:hypothetical protein